MTATILFCKRSGAYSYDQNEMTVTRLTDFVSVVRGHFDESPDAVGVVKDGIAVAIWLAEPDIDCDSDGPYEVRPAYPGQEYVRYTEDNRDFWNLIAGYFGSRYIPSDVGFIAKFPTGESTATASLDDGSESLTAAEHNSSMLRR